MGDSLAATEPDPAEVVIDYGTSTNTVCGVSLVLMRFTPVSLSRCKVAYYQYLDACGIVPASVVSSKIPQAIMIVADLH